VLRIIMMIITFLLLFSTIICGLWIRYSGEKFEKSNIDFHMIIGVLAAISNAISIILLLKR